MVETPKAPKPPRLPSRRSEANTPKTTTRATQAKAVNQEENIEDLFKKLMGKRRGAIAGKKQAKEEQKNEQSKPKAPGKLRKFSDLSEALNQRKPFSEEHATEAIAPAFQSSKPVQTAPPLPPKMPSTQGMVLGTRAADTPPPLPPRDFVGDTPPPLPYRAPEVSVSKIESQHASLAHIAQSIADQTEQIRTTRERSAEGKTHLVDIFFTQMMQNGKKNPEIFDRIIQAIDIKIKEKGYGPIVEDLKAVKYVVKEIRDHDHTMRKINLERGKHASEETVKKEFQEVLLEFIDRQITERSAERAGFSEFELKGLTQQIERLNETIQVNHQGLEKEKIAQKAMQERLKKELKGVNTHLQDITKAIDLLDNDLQTLESKVEASESYIAALNKTQAELSWYQFGEKSSVRKEIARVEETISNFYAEAEKINHDYDALEISQDRAKEEKRIILSEIKDVENLLSNKVQTPLAKETLSLEAQLKSKMKSFDTSKQRYQEGFNQTVNLKASVLESILVKPAGVKLKENLQEMILSATLQTNLGSAGLDVEEAREENIAVLLEKVLELPEQMHSEAIGSLKVFYRGRQISLANALGYDESVTHGLYQKDDHAEFSELALGVSFKEAMQERIEELGLAYETQSITNRNVQDTQARVDGFNQMTEKELQDLNRAAKSHHDEMKPKQSTYQVIGAGIGAITSGVGALIGFLTVRPIKAIASLFQSAPESDTKVVATERRSVDPLNLNEAGGEGTLFEKGFRIVTGDKRSKGVEKDGNYTYTTSPEFRQDPLGRQDAFFDASNNSRAEFYSMLEKEAGKDFANKIKNWHTKQDSQKQKQSVKHSPQSTEFKVDWREKSLADRQISKNNQGERGR